MAMEGKQGAIRGWVYDRFPVKTVVEALGRKHVPVHRRTFTYYTGSLPLMFLVVQVITGIMLMFYYQPGLESSHASVKFIMTEVKFGWMIRSIHSWSANFMVLFAYVHMFTMAFNRSYRKPRELTWLTGIVMLTLLYAFGFMGYLLPWDQLAYFATQVGLKSFESIPVLGPEMVEFLQAGPEPSSLTLSRFYALHVWVLPIFLFLFLGLHLAFVQLQGDSVPDEWAMLPPEKKKYLPFVPDFLIRELPMQMAAFALLIGVAVIFPWPLGPEANPLDAAPEGIKPEWYFLAQFAVLKLVTFDLGPIGAELLALLVITIAISVWALLPFWDKKGKHAVKAASVGLALFIVFTIIGYVKE